MLDHATADASVNVTATTTVSNPGTRPLSTVAELYIQPPPVAGAPRLALAGAQHITLAAGESRELRFTLAPQDRSVVTPAGERILAAGTYRVSIGPAQPSTLNTGGATFRVEKTTAFDRPASR